MFQRLRKWFVLRAYARKLIAKLRERYGVSSQYSPNQVVRTVDKCGFSKEWIRYALCMFCNYSDLARHDATLASDYAAIRSEVARRFFRGQASFTAADFGKKPRPSVQVDNDGGSIPPDIMYGEGDFDGEDAGPG